MLCFWADISNTFDFKGGENVIYLPSRADFFVPLLRSVPNATSGFFFSHACARELCSVKPGVSCIVILSRVLFRASYNRHNIK